MYIPNTNVTVDESMVKVKGPLGFSAVLSDQACQEGNQNLGTQQQ